MKGAIANAVAELQRMSPPAVSEPFSKILVGLLTGTLLLAVMFYLLERLFPEQPQQRFVRKGTRVDAIYWFFDALVTKRLVTAVTIVVLITLVALRTPRASFVGGQPLWLQALEALLVANFCG